mgnify:CR=1 FL=1
MALIGAIAWGFVSPAARTALLASVASALEPFWFRGKGRMLRALLWQRVRAAFDLRIELLAQRRPCGQPAVQGGAERALQVAERARSLSEAIFERQYRDGPKKTDTDSTRAPRAP